MASTRSSDAHHVVPDPTGGWNVKRGGARRASKHFETKRQAVKYGRRLSRKQGTYLYIHRKDGTVQEVTRSR